jgi:nicotinamidase-related amidase
MSQVINLRTYIRAPNAATLVLMDLHQEQAAPPRMPADDLEPALANCRAALRQARQYGFPVAFARLLPPAERDNVATPITRWIGGVSPTRADMIFDRDKPSCYASPEFSDVIAQRGHHFVLAGLSGEGACLATVIDACHRGHKVTFLADASASHALGELRGDQTHRVVTDLIALYGTVTTTAEWIAACTRHASTAMRR